MKITAVETLVCHARMRNWIFVKVVTDQPGLYERLASGLLSLWVLLFVVTQWRAGLWQRALDWQRPDYAPRRRRFR